MLQNRLSQIANVNSITFSARIPMHCKQYALIQYSSVPQSFSTNADMPSQTTGINGAGKLRNQRPWLLCSTTALPERRSVTQHSVKRNTAVLLPAKYSFAAKALPELGAIAFRAACVI